MFESFEKDHMLNYCEYKQALYWLCHPDEYPGDYEEFKRQVTEVSSKIHHTATIKKHDHP